MGAVAGAMGGKVADPALVPHLIGLASVPICKLGLTGIISMLIAVSTRIVVVGSANTIFNRPVYTGGVAVV